MYPAANKYLNIGFAVELKYEVIIKDMMSD